MTSGRAVTRPIIFGGSSEDGLLDHPANKYKLILFIIGKEENNSIAV